MVSVQTTPGPSALNAISRLSGRVDYGLMGDSSVHTYIPNEAKAAGGGVRVRVELTTADRARIGRGERLVIESKSIFNQDSQGVFEIEFQAR
jgi:hypothetical protein